MKRRQFLSSILFAGPLMALASHANAQSGQGFMAQDIIIGAWHLYKTRFMQADGRVVDNVNGDITHSESQGYGMLLAVAANDRASFDKIWQWTQDNLFIREDKLAAWRWDPNSDPHVQDMNNATDGELLIAWALVRARLLWREEKYLNQARTIAIEIRNKLVIETPYGLALLPGAGGFSEEEQEDGPIINLSYWVFPAIAELGLIDPQFPDEELIETGITLLREASFGPTGLPANWISVTSEGVKPAVNFDAHFSYDAIRIPLYLAWYTNAYPDLLEPYQNTWLRDGTGSLEVIDLETGNAIGVMSDPGYRSLIDVVMCASGGGISNDLANNFTPTDYYPTTLYLLNMLALIERYPTCLIDQY